MAKPKEIRDNLSRYICSVVWVQEWGLQDPLKQPPTVSSKAYPPNAATEIPIEQLEILKRDDRAYPTNEPNALVCIAKFPFRITYVFAKDAYPSYRSLPISQLENLLFKASQLIILFANRVNEDILDIDIPQQQNPFIVRAADDIQSGDDGSRDWAITLKIDIDVKFLSSPEEFTNADYSDIQPANFGHPDDLELPDISYNPFDVKELRIDINRSELPAVNPDDIDSFVLDERIILKEID